MIDVLKILKLNKATSPDGISHRLLKLTHSTVSYPLTKLFNLSLKTYFASISTIDDTNTDLPYFEKRCNVDFTQIRITESEVIDVFKILKLNKATSPDGISHRLLKLTHSTVSYPLTKLFNLSLKTQTYPDLWKIAHVMPLFKKGD